jgi:hypothetical protein
MCVDFDISLECSFPWVPFDLTLTLVFDILIYNFIYGYIFWMVWTRTLIFHIGVPWTMVLTLWPWPWCLVDFTLPLKWYKSFNLSIWPTFLTLLMEFGTLGNIYVSQTHLVLCMIWQVSPENSQDCEKIRVPPSCSNYLVGQTFQYVFIIYTYTYRCILFILILLFHAILFSFMTI